MRIPPTRFTCCCRMALLSCVLPQVGCLVCYGLTYSFPVGEEEQQPQAPAYAAAPGQPLPRPAPLSPAVDMLHCYSCLGAPDSSSAAVPASRAAMPLVLRQMLAQMISAANIARIEQVRRRPRAAADTLMKAALAACCSLRQVFNTRVCCTQCQHLFVRMCQLKVLTHVFRVCLLLCCVARRGTTASCHPPRLRALAQAHMQASSPPVRQQQLHTPWVFSGAS
jgi:hypothetical protein